MAKNISRLIIIRIPADTRGGADTKFTTANIITNNFISSNGWRTPTFHIANANNKLPNAVINSVTPIIMTLRKGEIGSCFMSSPLGVVSRADSLHFKP